MDYLFNPELKSINSDWKGNPYAKGRFRYIDKPFRPDWMKMWQWMTRPKPQRLEKKRDKWRPNIHPDSYYLKSKDHNSITWLGHASFLIQLGGIRMVTDPVFSKLPFVPRFTYLPFDNAALNNIDYVLLSHDHRDHCDEKSIKNLLKHNQPKKILTSLKMSEVIKRWTGQTIIEEACWYQVYNTEEVEVIYLPAKHWCRRGLSDFNHHLWGSFIIRNQDTTIYFGADSGPGDHFSEIGHLFPDIDYAMIGIGAYKPDYMMQEIHTSPQQATEAFEQLGAKNLIPMHYGTMDLSDEPISEPYFSIQNIFEEKGMRNRLSLLDINQPLMF